jgi:hypothetical protein
MHDTVSKPMDAAEVDALERIRRRAADPATRTDWPSARGAQLFPPASDAHVAAAEESLDFALPAFLVRVYQAIGNGGFGPGAGLIGVPGGATDANGSSIVDLYDAFSADNPDDRAWRWPERLVPICQWSGAVYACVDCTGRDGAIVALDLTDWAPGRDLKHALSEQAPSALAWLSDWADGADLWQRMFPLDS